jgi:hypothetical protein
VEHVPTLVAAGVEHDTSLVAVERLEQHARAVVQRRHAAHVVALGRHLDLDHVGAEVGELRGGVRPRHEPGEVEHPDTIEQAQHVAPLPL